MSDTSSEVEYIEEEIDFNVMGVLPAQIQDVSNIEIKEINSKEIFIKVDDHELKGNFNESLGSSIFFGINDSEGEKSVDIKGISDRVVNFEHYFKIPVSELKKEFIPSDVYKR